jgi:acetyl esterase/lipase
VRPQSADMTSLFGQFRRRLARCAAALLAVGALTGCLVPNPGPGAVAADGAGLANATRYSAQYGPDVRYHRFDLYRPTTARFPAGAPLVIFVHGGSWEGGDRRADLRTYGESVTALVDAGWAVASIDYRLTRTGDGGAGVPHPAQAQDVTRAILWFKAHGARLGVDTATVVLAGHSAGGHLAALVGTACTRGRAGVVCNPAFRPSGLPVALNAHHARVDGVVTLAPVIDVAAFGDADVYGSRLAVNRLLGCVSASGLCDRRGAEALNPLRALDRTDPPWYMAHGDGDWLVPHEPHTALAYRRAVAALGDAQVWLDRVDGAGHSLDGVNAAYVAAFAEQVRTGRL